jgi:hypothetical protein
MSEPERMNRCIHELTRYPPLIYYSTAPPPSLPPHAVRRRCLPTAVAASPSLLPQRRHCLPTALPALPPGRCFYVVYIYDSFAFAL